MDLLVKPYTADNAGAVTVTAFMDVDIAVRHPESFAAIDDIVAKFGWRRRLRVRCRHGFGQPGFPLT